MEIEIRRLGPGGESVLAAGLLFDDAPGRDTRGIGSALVAALARERGCHGMWTGTDTDNEAAQCTYARAGARTAPVQLMIEWSFGEAAGR